MYEVYLSLMKHLFVSGVFPRISRRDNYCSARSACSACSAKCSYRKWQVSKQQFKDPQVCCCSLRSQQHSCGSVQELQQIKWWLGIHWQYSQKGQHCLQLYHVPIRRVEPDGKGTEGLPCDLATQSCPQHHHTNCDSLLLLVVSSKTFITFVTAYLGM